METLQSGRADQWQMLDAADMRLAEMEPVAARVVSWRDARPAAEELPAAIPAPPQPAPTSGPAPAPEQPAPAAAAPPSAPTPAPPVDGVRPRVPAAVRRGSARERGAAGRPVPAVGTEPAGRRGPARPASCLPHAQGQRPHGRRATHRRIFLEHRVAAEPRDQPDARPLPRHRRRGPRCGGGDAAADRRDRRRCERRTSTSPA